MGNTPGPFQGFIADSQPKLPSPVSLPNPVAPEMGLGGQPQGAQGDLTGQQPEPPQPHETVARHILDALGGANPNDKMGWAKSVISGGLAAAANVGKVPEGAGWLAGASRGAQGVVELKRQQEQDALRKQAQQQEMQLKQNADVRAQKELEIHLEDTKVQRALYTAQIAASTQAQQQNAARFPTLQKEDQLKVEQLNQQIRQSESDNLSILAAAGIDVTKLEHITSTDQLTDSHAKELGSGNLFPVPNGEAHAEGEDKAGAYMVPGDAWDKTITKPITITTGYTLDKNGKATPKTTEVQAGTKVGDLLAIAKGAQKDLLQKQTAIFDQAKLEHERASTAHEIAETELAKSQVGAGGPQKDILGGEYTPPAGGVKEYNKIRDSYKKDADSLSKTEGTFNQFQSVLNDINAGKDITGAQSVVALFNAIGISAEPLQGKGFRINHSTVEEHENARGLGESLYQKLLKLKNGDVITPQQIKDYATIAADSRRNAYVNKINQARSAGINPDFLLPRGNGQNVDANTAKIFYDTAAGNTPQEKAANTLAALKSLGWK